MEVPVSGSGAVFPSLGTLRLAAKRIVFVTIMFLFKQVIHSLD
jgi:hypothetical protein